MYEKNIHDLIDRRRRDVIQKRDTADDARVMMYYEGQRVALAEIQSIVKQYVDISK